MGIEICSNKKEVPFNWLLAASVRNSLKLLDAEVEATGAASADAGVAKEELCTEA
jgi:hypothetical protein